MIFRCLWTLNISVGEIDILPHREILSTVLALLEVFRYAQLVIADMMWCLSDSQTLCVELLPIRS